MLKPIVKFDQVSFSINTKQIIRDFSVTVYPGEFVILLGGNGSGKSTLLKLLNRTYSPTQGQIHLDEKSLKTYSADALRKKLITLTQFTNESLFSDFTLEENAIFIEHVLYKKAFDKKKFIEELPHYLSNFHPTLNKALKTKLQNLSGGEQQIAAFALYLRHQPDVLLLDEHTSALDPKKADHVMAFTQEIVKRRGITCLMTTHALQYALQYGSRVLAIREGELIFDADTEKKAQLSLHDLLQHCY